MPVESIAQIRTFNYFQIMKLIADNKAALWSQSCKESKVLVGAGAVIMFRLRLQVRHGNSVP
jgi:hypothetical protein